MKAQLPFYSALAAALLAASALPIWAADEPAPKTPPAPGSLPDTVARRGATMEEIHAMSASVVTTPDLALYQLKLGNSRFFNGTTSQPELSDSERRAQIIAQEPFVSVIGCADSRVPIEIVFDQGLGSLFVSRVAGNIVDPGTAGSMEYGAAILETPLLVILGHEGCGAVTAALKPAAEQAKLPVNVRYLLDKIKPALQDMPPIRDEKAKMREAVIANVRLQAYRLSQNPTVAASIKAGKTKVIGAYYEISSGAVDFLESPEDLRLTPAEMRRAQVDIRRLVAATPAHDHDVHDHDAHNHGSRDHDVH